MGSDHVCLLGNTGSERRTLIDPLRKWSALRASALNLRIVPRPLWMPDDYLRSIEPLIAIVLGCMRWKSAQAHEVRL